jgi:hypothetical protein
MEQSQSSEDIVQALRDMSFIIDESQGAAVVAMLSGSLFDDAADEIERLLAEVQEVWAVADVLATRLEAISSGNTIALREYDLRRDEADSG